MFKLRIFAKMGNLDSIKHIFEEEVVYPDQKAYVYAVLNERDSMYYYLDGMDVPWDFLNWINGYNAFDSYRQEEHFKTLQKKNYLPAMTPED